MLILNVEDLELILLFIGAPCVVEPKLNPLLGNSHEEIFPNHRPVADAVLRSRGYSPFVSDSFFQMHQL